jgi:peptidoglycan/LPS O-acetylase OafA/YrhL
LNFGTQLGALGYLVIMISLSCGLFQFEKVRRLLIFMGKYSYFIYFCHFQVLFGLARATRNFDLELFSPFSQIIVFILVFVTTLLISISIAIPSYRYLERPILKKAQLIR